MDFSRQKQLDDAEESLKNHRIIGNQIATAQRLRVDQQSQMDGLYEEVDKLAKGKTIVPASDLTVELINSLISDTKGLVHRDVYLDRVKMFVPAGDNPTYPDVLISLRIIKQCLSRFEDLLTDEGHSHRHIGEELMTIHAALQVARKDEARFYGNDDEPSGTDIEASEVDEDEDEEVEEEEDDEDYDAEYSDEAEESDDEAPQSYEEYVSKSEVQAQLGGSSASGEWFRRYNGDYVFNFSKLDSQGLPKYVPPAEGTTFLRPEHA